MGNGYICNLSIAETIETIVIRIVALFILLKRLNNLSRIRVSVAFYQKEIFFRILTYLHYIYMVYK